MSKLCYDSMVLFRTLHITPLHLVRQKFTEIPARNYREDILRFDKSSPKFLRYVNCKARGEFRAPNFGNSETFTTTETTRITIHYSPATKSCPELLIIRPSRAIRVSKWWKTMLLPNPNFGALQPQTEYICHRSL